MITSSVTSPSRDYVAQFHATRPIEFPPTELIFRAKTSLDLNNSLADILGNAATTWQLIFDSLLPHPLTNSNAPFVLEDDDRNRLTPIVSNTKTSIDELVQHYSDQFPLFTTQLPLADRRIKTSQRSFIGTLSRLEGQTDSLIRILSHDLRVVFADIPEIPTNTDTYAHFCLREQLPCGRNIYYRTIEPRFLTRATVYFLSNIKPPWSIHFPRLTW